MPDSAVAEDYATTFAFEGQGLAPELWSTISTSV